MLTGTLVGVFGGLLAATGAADFRRALMLAAVAVITTSSLLGRPLQLPQKKRLVGQDIIARGNLGGPFQFGVEMGSGVRTYLPSPLAHGLAVMVALTGDPFVGILAGAGFGLGRWLLPAGGEWSGDYERWETTLLEKIRGVERLCAVGLIAVAAVLFIG